MATELEMRTWIVTTAVACTLLLFSSPAKAVPILQTYIEGGTYVGGGDDTWVMNPADGKTLRLWVVGNTDKSSTIQDVRLYVAFPTGIPGVSISITPTTIGGAAADPLVLQGINFLDPSTPANPTAGATGNGTTPSGLPPHGIYGGGTSWNEYLLGDFTLTDSTLANFEPTIGDVKTNGAQINAYDIVITADPAAPPFYVHFDATGKETLPHGMLKSTFAPPSHDTGGYFGPPPTTSAPEPATFLLLIIGAVTTLGGRWWSGRRKDG